MQNVETEELADEGKNKTFNSEADRRLKFGIKCGLIPHQDLRNEGESSLLSLR